MAEFNVTVQAMLIDVLVKNLPHISSCLELLLCEIMFLFTWKTTSGFLCVFLYQKNSCPTFHLCNQ